MKFRLPSFSYCFCCGESHPKGLRAKFYVDGNYVVCEYSPPADYCGYPGILHGGISATLLDEAMTWAASVFNKKFHYAGEVKVRYRAPVISDDKIVVKASVTNTLKKWVVVGGEIIDKNGKTLVRAEGKYYPLTDEQDQSIRENMKVFENGFLF